MPLAASYNKWSYPDPKKVSYITKRVRTAITRLAEVLSYHENHAHHKPVAVWFEHQRLVYAVSRGQICKKSNVGAIIILNSCAIKEPLKWIKVTTCDDPKPNVACLRIPATHASEIEHWVHWRLQQHHVQYIWFNARLKQVADRVIIGCIHPKIKTSFRIALLTPSNWLPLKPRLLLQPSRRARYWSPWLPF